MRIEKFKHTTDHNTNNTKSDDISDLNLNLYKVSQVARYLGHAEASDILDMAMVVLEEEENIKKQQLAKNN